MLEGTKGIGVVVSEGERNLMLIEKREREGEKEGEKGRESEGMFEGKGEDLSLISGIEERDKCEGEVLKEGRERREGRRKKSLERIMLGV